jgi:tripartite-type tricarboxylate transporter receptor subunit TctC
MIMTTRHTTRRPVLAHGANTTRRRLLALSAAAFATPFVSKLSFAQAAWPTRTIRCMIPFSAGSSVDIVGRMVLEPLSQALGQPVVVENRGGAGGSIGSGMVAQAEPDGYTILVNAAAHSAAPAAFPNITYDPAAEFAGVVMFGTVPNVVIISPEKGIKTLDELVAKAKKESLTFGSAGVGSATHWAAERLRVSAGFQAVHVPFRGGPEAINEVMTGRVDFACMGISSAMGFIQSGKLVPLAVSTPKRSSALPNVPTTLEAGYKDSDYSFWNGMLVPAKTPKDIVEKLRAETQKVLDTPAMQAKFKPQGIEPMPLTPAEFDALIRKEIKDNIELVKAAGLKFR